MICRSCIRTSGLLLFVVFTGCWRNRVQIFPICFYDTTADGTQRAADAWPGLRLRMYNALSLVASDSPSVVIVNSRVAVVRASRSRIEAIQRIWPGVACYGNSGGSASSQLLSSCQKFIDLYLQTGWQASEQATSPACLTVPTKDDPVTINPASALHR